MKRDPNRKVICSRANRCSVTGCVHRSPHYICKYGGPVSACTEWDECCAATDENGAMLKSQCRKARVA